jgi:chorismate mutase
MGSDAGDATPSLDEVRWRIDAIDGELLALLDERAGLARAVAAAKQAAGDTGFGLRPGREALIVRCWPPPAPPPATPWSCASGAS